MLKVFRFFFFLKKFHDAVRHEGNNHDEETSVDDSRKFRCHECGEAFVDQGEDYGAHDGTQPRSPAAEKGHEHDEYGDIDVKDDVGMNVGQILGVDSARHAGEKGRNCKGLDLDSRGV